MNTEQVAAEILKRARHHVATDVGRWIEAVIDGEREMLLSDTRAAEIERGRAFAREDVDTDREYRIANAWTRAAYWLALALATNHELGEAIVHYHQTTINIYAKEMEMELD
jgi:hypothetical protein